jgi:hypothetical protein
VVTATRAAAANIITESRVSERREEYKRPL